MKTKGGLSIVNTEVGFWKVEDAAGNEIGKIQRERQGQFFFAVSENVRLSATALREISDFIDTMMRPS